MKLITKILKKANNLSDSEFRKFCGNANSTTPLYLDGTNLLLIFKVRENVMQVDVRLDDDKFNGSHSIFFEDEPNKNDFVYCLISAIKELFKLKEAYDNRKNSL